MDIAPLISPLDQPPSKPHALVLPVPAQGHINPMLNFSLQLAKRGFIITFLNTEKAHDRILQFQSQSQHISSSLGVDIRFAAIPDGSQEPLPGHGGQFQMSSMVAIIQGIASQQDLIEEMVITSRATPQPITCIIADSFLPWTHDLAVKLGIKRVLFWTSNGASLAIALDMKRGKFKFADVDDPNEVADEEESVIAGVSALRRSDFISALPFHDPQRVKVFKERLHGVEAGTSCIIVVNTFEELEACSLEAASSSKADVRYVGPILPPPTVGDGNATILSASFYQEESGCIPWLDQQAPGSVLYISFGSIAILAPSQLEELAIGIEHSKQPFLWVARHNHNLFPEGFLDRIGHLGLVVNWAPQIQVLEHFAIGGFLTHCGWNSTLESIHMGVPMLCYPMLNDQHLNALLITKAWKLGIGMQKGGDDGVITRGEVQSAVTTLMHSQELRQQAVALKAASHHALAQGGSSYFALESIIHDLTQT